MGRIGKPLIVFLEAESLALPVAILPDFYKY